MLNPKRLSDLTARRCGVLVQRCATKVEPRDLDRPRSAEDEKTRPRFTEVGCNRLQVFQLEGLAVAIPWGFESPISHH